MRSLLIFSLTVLTFSACYGCGDMKKMMQMMKAGEDDNMFNGLYGISSMACDGVEADDFSDVEIEAASENDVCQSTTLESVLIGEETAQDYEEYQGDEDKPKPKPRPQCGKCCKIGAKFARRVRPRKCPFIQCKNFYIRFYKAHKRCIKHPKVCGFFFIKCCMRHHQADLDILPLGQQSETAATDINENFLF